MRPGDTYQKVVTRYIAHKVQLGKCANYKTNMRFQRALARLRDLHTWLIRAGKHADQVTAFRTIKLYRNELYDVLPHAGNKSYESCLQILKEIFE